MLELQRIRENKEEVIARLAVKNFDAKKIVEEIAELDQQRRSKQKQLDDTLARSKQLAKEIGRYFKNGEKEKAEATRQESLKLKEQAKTLSAELDTLAKNLNSKMVELPNLPHVSVPKGNSDADNEVVFSEGEIPALPENALPHWELADKYKIIDFDLGSKVTGAGFPFYRGKGARLQRALINFFLDEAIAAGYLEYQPPLLINEASGFGTGQLPDKEGQMYYVGLDKLYLIPTAEVPITNIYRNVILKEADLPVKNVAYSNCFRREAGSYGKDVRGLNRLHQFDKVEIVQIQHPDKSYDTLEEMKAHVAGLLRKLELPFRILRLCGGDLSFTSALTFDFEVFSGAQKRWLEVSSVSNFESYQANRMKLRFKGKDGKTRLAHTLNGSALALPRIVAALLENNQTPEGIKIPKALQSYTGFEMID
ncbi:serine--tRNA ligase [Candidatus Sulfidibacterium hydrothermale]|uniref:serine--tRNA ligase n=1 Tax=Candidatus Sulfidibacterium hydrothermale TaxID=2875962 RepID=UPI001F0A1F2C|nr:serine--tRNA ligase [Candidatus Sulfidibacterium hydrothermale]UBM62911.1 serine--tRNA ligase [Candidatus Sulfidibacterium hydrothermale]